MFLASFCLPHTSVTLLVESNSCLPLQPLSRPRNLPARRAPGLPHLPAAGRGAAGAIAATGAEAVLRRLHRAGRPPGGRRVQRRRDSLRRRQREGLPQAGSLHGVAGGHGQVRESPTGEQAVTFSESTRLYESFGPQIRVFGRSNTKFRHPIDLCTNVIMVGPGTGVAPFRGFLQLRAKRTKDEMADQNKVGSSILFFGCRHKEKDFLFRCVFSL